ncbi:unnamed protein product [Mytilus coruscus]|uniref:Uncharacterized protein n=1 Tax=Mytilus coruscus TaxID=42192 RepID=A0A6J8CK42_MYTCO|nr:unnamed protein product [Mytilus coruscus]
MKTLTLNQREGNCHMIVQKMAVSNHLAQMRHWITTYCRKTNYKQVISVHDKAKIMYGTKVNSLFINTQSVSIPSDSMAGESGLRQGWALKTKKKRVIFSEAQRKYMQDRFYAGKRTGSKVDPFRAAEEMKNMKEEDQYLLKRNEYLTGQQISSYFSRLAMKDRNSEPGDFKSAEEEDSKLELKIKILQQLAK